MKELPPWDSNDDLIATHPELHHYTSRDGLRGIWQSQSIWATHFKNLSDSKEILLARPLLIQALVGRFRELALDLRSHSFSIRRRVDRAGGLDHVVSELATSFVDAYYKVSFTGHASIPIAEPFITSFCSHSGDHEYERQNGLLSQWRGYGTHGRFSLVFDTRGVDDLLREEWTSFYWTKLSINKVVYANSDTILEERFPAFAKVSADFMRGYLDKNEMEGAEEVFPQFADVATLLKHRGFHEEREVRIVAIPRTYEAAAVRGLVSDFEGWPPLKPIRDLNRRKYVVLFDTQKAPLPIKRIIVGPSATQSDDLKFAKELVEGRVEIRISETPFIG